MRPGVIRPMGRRMRCSDRLGRRGAFTCAELTGTRVCDVFRQLRLRCVLNPAEEIDRYVVELVLLA